MSPEHKTLVVLIMEANEIPSTIKYIENNSGELQHSWIHFKKHEQGIKYKWPEKHEKSRTENVKDVKRGKEFQEGGTDQRHDKLQGG